MDNNSREILISYYYILTCCVDGTNQLGEITLEEVPGKLYIIWFIINLLLIYINISIYYIILL